MAKTTWIDKAIIQTQKAIKVMNTSRFVVPSTSRFDCLVCKYVKGVYKIAPDSPFEVHKYGCRNRSDKLCPATVMCKKYINMVSGRVYRGPMLKNLMKHLKELQEMKNSGLG